MVLTLFYCLSSERYDNRLSRLSVARFQATAVVLKIYCISFWMLSRVHWHLLTFRNNQSSTACPLQIVPKGSPDTPVTARRRGLTSQNSKYLKQYYFSFDIFHCIVKVI
jgi:hypothetical protein